MGIKVSNRLQELRKQEGLTQDDLARTLEVTRQTIISIEKAEYVPTTGLALKIAKFFKKPVEKIFWLTK